MNTFQSKYIPRCIIWAAGGQMVISNIFVLFMMPVAQYMSANRDPSPLFPATLISCVVTCAFMVCAEYACLGKAMNECEILPADPKRWFGIFTLVQLGIQVKDAISRWINYRRLYNLLFSQLNGFPYSSDQKATLDYMESYLSAFNRSVLISMIVGIVMMGLSYFILLGRFQSLRKNFAP
ncbi:MAG: hypothetical protein IIZ09_13800 [Ruminococcus sp.]|nr:hypothetical protein [Ruminococcus sp.]